MTSDLRFIKVIGLLIGSVLLFSACKEEETIILPATITTTEVSSITKTTALSGGQILNTGGGTISEKGICWDTNPNPTHLLVTKSIAQNDSESFTSELSELEPGQLYYVRAYAINEVGVSFGNEISFTTNISTVIHKMIDNHIQYGDPAPLTLDINEDGTVDFTVFIELTANSQGDHLYFGINPIGPHLIKSGPSIDTNFLSMGFAIAEETNNIINEHLKISEQWTGNHSALFIKHILNDGSNTYEGNWTSGEVIIGIQLYITDSYHFGWLRLNFNQENGILDVIDLAYDSTPTNPIYAGSPF